MQTHYTTINEQPHRRKSYWEQVVTKTYFSLSVDFNTETQFQGHLCAWDLGPISLSRLDSDGLLYQRKDEHLRHEHEENYLVTIPGSLLISLRGIVMWVVSRVHLFCNVAMSLIV